ncbi:D-glycero-beta-D-manno-heptose-7-phosphate kinase [Orrella sp. 11846]|uniref:D-glycero-beta-D-manno-heptose-7-phosphate kinase n=1 Tax=Orrella sp. 11846 TaxID=3409913 RepID=UPI003B58F808
MKAFPRLAVRQTRILIIGDIMLDRYWFGEVERISPEAPVPVVHVARREDRLGGAANVARNARALGAQVMLAGIIGKDEAGQAVQGLLEADGIEHALIQDVDFPTIVKMRVLARQQQMMRVDFEQKPTQACVSRLTQQLLDQIDKADVLVLSDYAKGVLGQVEALIAHARKREIPVLVDPKGLDYERYEGSSLITPNRAELQQIVGLWQSEAELEEKAQLLRQRLNLEGLLVTRSEQGMTLYTDRQRAHEDAQAQEVFDVSGAGDTVLATLAVMRATGASWEQAMQWANRAGGIVVGKLGTSTVTAEEME